jgi:hypothetical protein
MIDIRQIKVITRTRIMQTMHKYPVVALALVFALIGAVMLHASHAGTSTIALEPETGTLSSGVTAGIDSQASGGRYVHFGTTIVTPALASITADCTIDVTAALNAAIKAQPDGANLLFPANACYVINGTLLLQDRQNLNIDGNGSTFKQVIVPAAKTGISQWEILGGANITLSNMTVQGVNTKASFDGNHEWDHNFEIAGTQTAMLDNVHGKNAGGDFVDIQPDTRKVTNSDGTGGVIPKNITLKNSDINISGRNAVSCTGCDTVTITGNTFNNIGYQGIDVEIEAAKWYGRNISVTNNTYGPVQLSNFSASGFGLDTTNLTFANNTATASVKTCQPPVYFDSSTPRNTIKITGNSLIGIGTGIYIERGTDVTVENNIVKLVTGCSAYRGIYASNVNGGTVRGNDFSSSAAGLALFNLQQPITNVVACGNKVPGGSAFDAPTVCAAP